MEVRIGIKHSARELAFESDQSADELRTIIQDAANNKTVLVAVTDSKGRQYLVNVDSISYVEFGADAGRKVGFIS